ncbi:hypothetical protein [Blastopirellula marina]|uniref:Uncharacterized protein n=1 Tax=Blastopirellula marina DSM 3645 TaxID=314230 RepID=A3ZXE8_9BACT|nr:hypothetical protein [Blastopirellula marina]EAQ78738.1 hypothetical protein DSM3645_29591 [Blastopirellula marina DSM 3645]
MYDQSDLEIIDPIDHIRQRPEMYLPGGDTSGSALAQRLFFDMQSTFDCLIIAQQIGDWRILGSDHNWVSDVADPRDVFRRIVPFSRDGQVCFHAEILLAALASQVVVFDRLQYEVIQGDAAIPCEVLGLPQQMPQLVRCVAFLVEK